MGRMVDGSRTLPSTLARWTLTLLVHAQCTDTGRKRRTALRKKCDHTVDLDLRVDLRVESTHGSLA